MSGDSGFTIATAFVDVEPDTTGFEKVVRVIAKHLTAMADELKADREERNAATSGGTP